MGTAAVLFSYIRYMWLLQVTAFLKGEYFFSFFFSCDVGKGEWELIAESPGFD